MATYCEYCRTGTDLSKEHVIPSWLCGETRDYTAQVVRGSDGLRWDPSNLTTKDVCKSCNNGVLSTLDGYAKECWDEHLAQIIRQGDPPRTADLDEKLLTRWLAKTSYNMARAKDASADVAALRDLVPFILGTGAPTRRYALYHGTVIPTPVTDDMREALEDKTLNEIPPQGLRLSVIDDPRVVGGPVATVRIVGLHSNVFFLAISSAPQPKRREWKRALGRFERLAPIATPFRSPLVIRPSPFDAVSFGGVPMLRDAGGYARSIERGKRGFGGRQKN